MTKYKKHVFKAVLAGVLCATGALVWTGCDTASADEELVLSPSTAVLSSGQSQLFTVSGGYHYTWSISGSTSSTSSTSTAQGNLSSLTGSEVRYFAPPSGTLSGKVTLNVTSTIPSSGSSSSNSPAYSVSGHADITFK